MTNFTNVVTTLTNTSVLSNSTSTITVAQILGYQPSASAALLFCILFFVMAVIILLITIRTRCWLMFIVVITGIICGFGFYCRYLVANTETITFGPFVGNILLILVAPNGLALVDYSVLGRIIASYHGMIHKDNPNRHKTYFRIPYVMDVYGYIVAKRVAKLFIFSDVVAFVLQTAGGIMSGDADPDTAQRGRNVVIVGIVIQFIFVALFIMLCSRVYIIHRNQVRQHPEFVQLLDGTHYDLHRLQWVFVALGLTMVLFIVRNLYRLFEFTSTTVASNEVYFYIFDSLPVLGIFIVFAILHFGFWLPNSEFKMVDEEPSRDYNNAPINIQLHTPSEEDGVPNP